MKNVNIIRYTLLTFLFVLVSCVFVESVLADNSDKYEDDKWYDVCVCERYIPDNTEGGSTPITNWFVIDSNDAGQGEDSVNNNIGWYSDLNSYIPTKNNCSNFLNGVPDLMAYEISCKVQSCQFDATGFDSFDDCSDIEVYVPETSTNIIWKQDLGSAGSGKEIKFGEAGVVKLFVDEPGGGNPGKAGVSFSCESGCSSFIKLENKADGEAEIVLSKDLVLATFEVSVQANRGSMHVKRTVYISIVPTDNCQKAIPANILAKCETSPQACSNACKKNSGEKCELKGSACVDKTSGGTTTSTPTPTPGQPPGGIAWTSEATQAYYEGLYQTDPEIQAYLKGGGNIPACAFSGTCRNINDLLQLIINFGANMFAIIGSFAFAFFIYGGFTMIISFGNAEKVKKGRDIMVAAVVGLVISLSAYLLIDFILEALKVTDTFRGIK